MLAAVYHGVEDLRVEEVERPVIAADEALMKTRTCAICGTDVRMYRFDGLKMSKGMKGILGHEFAGDIVEVGEGVKGLRTGMRVTVAPNVGCGGCRVCAQGYPNLCPGYRAFGISIDGGFAEYMRITADAIRQGNVVKIPKGLSYEEAAINEPLACCYNGFKACSPVPGDIALIIGAGPIGIMHLLLLKMAGVGKVMVSELSDERLRKAGKFGADVLVNPLKEDLASRVKRETEGRGADVIIVACPSPEAQEQSLELASIHGRINFFGGLPKGREIIKFNSNQVHYKELLVTGTTRSNTYQFMRTLDLMALRKINVTPLITGKFSLKDIVKAMQNAVAGKGLKTLIYP